MVWRSEKEKNTPASRQLQTMAINQWVDPDQPSQPRQTNSMQRQWCPSVDVDASTTYTQHDKMLTPARFWPYKTKGGGGSLRPGRQRHTAADIIFNSPKSFAEKWISKFRIITPDDFCLHNPPVPTRRDNSFLFSYFIFYGYFSVCAFFSLAPSRFTEFEMRSFVQLIK